MIFAACIAVFLSAQLPVQKADTLSAATVSAMKALPVVQASESVDLSGLVSPPEQLAQALQRFTGVQVKDYGGAGGLKTVNVRSLGSEHVGIFLDGIQIDNAQNMQVDLGRFSTDNLGQVQLFNGQKAKRLQTAKEYAAGASVYLESRVPQESGGRVQLKGGSFGTVNPSVQWNRRLGRGVILRASADFLTGNGRYKYPCFDTTLVRENGDITALRLEGQLFGQVNKGDWNIHLYTYGSQRGFPGPVIRRAAAFPFSAERQADQDLFLQGGWTQEWTGCYSSALRFKYANSYTHYNTHPERNPMALPYNLHYRQQSAYLSLAQSFVLAGPWSIDLSTDIQYSALDSDVGQFVTPRRTVFTGALATRVVWERFRAAAHVVYLGAWDRFETPHAGGWSRENRYRDCWMPSLILFWKPCSWLETDAFAKRSYRLPSFNDLYYGLVGNASLEPEDALQLGMDLYLKASSGAWCWDWRISPYYNRVGNKIVAIPTANQFRWTMLNIGLVDIAGLDMKADATLRLGRWTLSGILRYSLARAMDHSAPGSQTWGNQIPYIPMHSGSLSLEASWKGWKLGWDTTATGERWSRSANTADYHLPPWSISDVSFAYHFDKFCLDLGLSVRNVFNHRYQIVQGYPMPGISLLANLSYQW